LLAKGKAPRLVHLDALCNQPHTKEEESMDSLTLDSPGKHYQDYQEGEELAHSLVLNFETSVISIDYDGRERFQLGDLVLKNHEKSSNGMIAGFSCGLMLEIESLINTNLELGELVNEIISSYTD